jgi:hypothetical protein
MRQHMPDIEPSKLVIDLGNQMEVVALAFEHVDVEHGVPPNPVRSWKNLPDILKRLPSLLLGDPIPGIESSTKIAMHQSRFQQSPSANDVHFALSPIGFAICELVKGCLNSLPDACAAIGLFCLSGSDTVYNSSINAPLACRFSNGSEVNV